MFKKILKIIKSYWYYEISVEKTNKYIYNIIINKLGEIKEYPIIFIDETGSIYGLKDIEVTYEYIGDIEYLMGRIGKKLLTMIYK